MTIHIHVILSLFLVISLSAKTEKLSHNFYTTPKSTVSKTEMRNTLVAESHQKFLIEISDYFEDWLKSDSFFMECSEELQAFILEEVDNYVKNTVVTKVVRETWIENSYYLKTRVTFDPIEILRMVNNSFELKENSNELHRLEDAIFTKKLEVKLLKDSLKLLNQKIVVLKDSLTRKKKALLKSSDNLKKMQDNQVEIHAEYQKVLDNQAMFQLTVDSFYNAQNDISNMVLSSVRVGMTENEIYRLLDKAFAHHALGKERNILGWNRRTVVIANTYTCKKIGNTWLIFYDDELMSIIKNGNFEYARSHYKRDVQTAYSYFIQNDISVKSE